MAYTQTTYGGFTYRYILQIFVIIITMLGLMVLSFIRIIAMAMLMLWPSDDDDGGGDDDSDGKDDGRDDDKG